MTSYWMGSHRNVQSPVVWYLICFRLNLLQWSNMYRVLVIWGLISCRWKLLQWGVLEMPRAPMICHLTVCIKYITVQCNICNYSLRINDVNKTKMLKKSSENVLLSTCTLSLSIIDGHIINDSDIKWHKSLCLPFN